MNNPSRLSQSKDFIRPKQTIQDTLTPDQIKEKLLGYVKVDSISSVPLKSHVRYMTLSTDPKTNELVQQFRLGGFLANKDHCDKYVILNNGSKSWSVQVGKTIFYRKISQTEQEKGHLGEILEHKNKYNKMVDAYKKEIKEKDMIIEKLVAKLKSYKKNNI